MIRGKWFGSDIPEQEWEGKYLNERQKIRQRAWIFLIAIFLIVWVGYFFTIEQLKEPLQTLERVYVEKAISEKAELEKIGAMAQNLDCNYEIWADDLITLKNLGECAWQEIVM